MPEHCRTFHLDQTHHGSMSGVGLAPWDAGVPAVVGTGETVTGGGVHGIKVEYGGGYDW